MSPQPECTTLGILIFPGFPMACLTSCIEPLRAANEISGQTAFDWVVISESTARIQSSAGVTFAPDLALSEVEKLDHLLFASSPNSAFDAPSKANAALQRLIRNKTRIGAISGGVFPLARTNLTGDTPLSVHWCYEAAFQSEFPHIPINGSVICKEASITTISGASAVFDHMLELIEERLGGDIMAEVACWFQHPFIRSENVTQKVPAISTPQSEDLLPSQIAKAIAHFAEHIENPIQISEVAASVGLSARSLERSFKNATGQSPLVYYRRMRMKQARQLVLYTNVSIAEVAYMVGYATPGTFIRYYRETYGVTPVSDRRAKNSMRVGSDDALPSG
ncbi:helix-turn-helix domain-containing protein [Shimia sp. R10_1]|uniref:GlxA family transcriptional regulator n=1 Tax=Shimia sp. R10_1 TaxID=2821095 RepID=UPI001ADC5DA7|nr:helix-turn-helix domain-containing protein [Shimia sp. R10_1]MBO9475258.1 helix-turn-helix domain-containing protein [Shimia sp. R10_1]